KGGWYNFLKKRIPDIANAGTTHVWLPPPSQHAAPQEKKEKAKNRNAPISNFELGALRIPKSNLLSLHLHQQTQKAKSTEKLRMGGSHSREDLDISDSEDEYETE
ncbi:hypothetical protein CISIN_1g047360mg, partial [Citrus sinensis]